MWRPSGILPSNSMEKPQRGEGGAHVYSVQQDEAEGPLHPLLSPFGHEGWDPQDAATEALQPPQETRPPLFTGQIPEGPLHHGGVHGHQISPPPNIFVVILHWCQVTPTKDTQGFYILILRNTTIQQASKMQVSFSSEGALTKVHYTALASSLLIFSCNLYTLRLEDFLSALSICPGCLNCRKKLIKI